MAPQEDNIIEPTDFLDSMIHALGLEVREIRRRGGSTSIMVRGGQRTGSAEGHTLYAFPLTEDIQLRDDTPVRVTIGTDDVDGIIVAMSEDTLVIALEKDVGPSIPSARVVADDSFLIERLKTKLEKIRAGETGFQHTQALG